MNAYKYNHNATYQPGGGYDSKKKINLSQLSILEDSQGSNFMVKFSDIFEK